FLPRSGRGQGVLGASMSLRGDRERERGESSLLPLTFRARSRYPPRHTEAGTMAIDLKNIPAATRQKQIERGRQYGSTDTLAQANQTLNALGTYTKELAAEGFVAADAERLADARDMLIEAGVGRETARGEKKSTNQAYADALKDGKAM